MKIIGKTEGGYIVEATSEELSNAAGYRTAADAPGWTSGHRYYGDGTFAIGTKFKVTETHKFLHDLRQQEAKVRDAAAQLKALSQMMTAALPSTVVPPTTGEAASEPAT